MISVGVYVGTFIPDFLEFDLTLRSPLSIPPDVILTQIK